MPIEDLGQIDEGNFWQYNVKGVWYLAHEASVNSTNENLNMIQGKFKDRKHASGYIVYTARRDFGGVSLRCDSGRVYWKAHR